MPLAEREEAASSPFLRLARVGVMLAVFGPALLYANVWDGGRSIFKFLALAAGGGLALVAVPRLASALPKERRPAATPPDAAVALYAGWVLLATIAAPDRLLALTGWRLYWDGAVAALASAAVYLACRMLAAAGPRRWPRDLVTAAAATLLVLAAALALALLGMPGTSSLLRFGRAGSLMGQPTFLAGLIVIWLPALAVLAPPSVRALAPAAGSGRAARARAAVVLAGLASAAVLLPASRSRAGLGAALVALTLHALLAAKSRRDLARRAGLAALAGVLALGLLVALRTDLGPTAADRLAALTRPFASSSSVTRSAAWGAAVEDARRRPLFGTGPGSFAESYMRATTPATHRAEGDIILLDAHDWYLNASATAGLPAGLAAVLIVLSALVCAVRARGRRGLALPMACGVVGYGVHCLVTPNSIATFPSMLAALGLAASAAAPLAGRSTTAADIEGAPPSEARDAGAIAGKLARAGRPMAAGALALAALLLAWGVRTTWAEIDHARAGASGSLTAARAAVRLAPEVWEYRLRAADLAMAVSRRGQASPGLGLTLLRDAVASSPRNGLLATRAGGLAVSHALSLQSAGDESAAAVFAEGVDWSRRGVRMRPRDPAARATLVWALAQAGRETEARAELEVLRTMLPADDVLLRQTAALLP